MWQLEVPLISASRRSSAAESGAWPSIFAPSMPRPPAWASMIDTPTGVPGARPSSLAARGVKPAMRSPIGRTRVPIRA
jgi:hypothetical protein